MHYVQPLVLTGLSIGYLIVSLEEYGFDQRFVGVVFFLGFAVSCILFSESIAEAFGRPSPLHFGEKHTSAHFVKIGGWILFLLPVLFFLKDQWG